MKKRLTIEILPEYESVFRDFKAKCVKKGVSIRMAITAMVLDYLKQ